MPPIIKARAAMAILPPTGLGMISIKPIKVAMARPNRPMVLSWARSLPAPISALKSIGVFISVMNLSTMVRCVEPLAGANGMDIRKPSDPAVSTPKNLAWNVHVASGENPKVDSGTFRNARSATKRPQLIESSAAHDGVLRMNSPHIRGIWIGDIKSAPTSSMISKIPLPFCCAR